MRPIIHAKDKDCFFKWDSEKKSYFLKNRPKCGFGFGQIVSKVVQVKKKHIIYKMG